MYGLVYKCTIAAGIKIHLVWGADASWTGHYDKIGHRGTLHLLLIGHTAHFIVDHRSDQFIGFFNNDKSLVVSEANGT